jgi:hypothetical protein
MSEGLELFIDQQIEILWILAAGARLCNASFPTSRLVLVQMVLICQSI